MTIAERPRSADQVAAPSHRHLHDWAADLLAFTAVMLTAAIPIFPPMRMHPGAHVLIFALALVPALLLLLRRRAPITILVACFVCFAFATLSELPSFGSGVAMTIAAFGVANRTSRRTALIAGAATAGLVALLSILVAQSGGVDFASFANAQSGVFDLRVFQVAAAVAVASALGDSTRSRREYVAAVTERAERAEQTREAEARRRVAEERLRIAQDLHDTVAHRISVISLNAGVASGALAERPAKAEEALGTIRGAARDVLSEIGELMRYLRSDERDGQAAPPQPGLHELDALLRRMSETGLQIETRIDHDLSRVAGTADLVAYRVVQEGLANAHKHGAGHRAALEIAVGEREVRITVRNPIASAEPNHPDAPTGGLGLVGLHERVAQLGGTVSAELAGDGYRLEAVLPLGEGALP